MAASESSCLLQLLNQGSVLLIRFVECWSGICVRAKLEFNEVNVSIFMRDISGVCVIGSSWNGREQDAIRAALMPKILTLMMREYPIWDVSVDVVRWLNVEF